MPCVSVEAHKEDWAVARYEGLVVTAWASGLALPHRGCLILDTLPTFSMPQFTCKMERIPQAPSPEVIAFVMIKWENPHKCLEGCPAHSDCSVNN